MGHQTPPICWQAVNGHAAVDSEIPVDKEVVKSIFGKAKPQLVDLLDLPVADESFCFWEYLHSTDGRIIENDV
ncbi:Protein amidase [Fusarium oxysporum f. sp. albedinis]|nr:Protein amidase [Fusarium oxysporum f. sp. albedinis]